MLFWIVAALLTLAASLTVLVPLTRGDGRAIGPDANDLEVYRDQLAEVDRDLTRGLIDANEAEQARAEIGRRILRLSDAATSSTAARPSQLSRAVGAAAVLAVPLISWGAYAALGAPDLPSQPLSARLAKDPANSSPDELVARAERTLRQNPADGRGWDVLAPVYQRLGRSDEAVFAYRNAIKLLGSTAAREAGLGEALSGAAGGTVTADAHAAFERALKLEPGFPKASFFIGVAAAQEGKLATAISGWTAMAAALPEDHAWRQAAEQAIALASERQAAAAPLAGPDGDDVAAAENLSGEERAQMIEAMVASLDEKLKTNPADGEGWKRLVRSYLVLGKADAARDALKRGQAALGAGAAADELVAFAATLGLATTE